MHRYITRIRGNEGMHHKNPPKKPTHRPAKVSTITIVSHVQLPAFYCLPTYIKVAQFVASGCRRRPSQLTSEKRIGKPIHPDEKKTTVSEREDIKNSLQPTLLVVIVRNWAKHCVYSVKSVQL